MIVRMVTRSVVVAVTCLAASLVASASASAQPTPPPAGPEAVEARVAVDLNLRLEPSTTAPRLTVIPAGSIVSVYRCTVLYTWCEVSYLAQTGWVSANYIISVTNQAPIAEIGAVLGIELDFAFGQIGVQPAPQAPPGADEVCFFEDINYQGQSFCVAMAAGGVTSQSNAALGADWNDRMSSIRVGANVSVQVCREIQFGEPCRMFDADVAELPGDVDDAISSYRVFAGKVAGPLPVTPAPDQVCFYADFNYQGAAFCVPVGQSNATVSATWSNRISSIRVGANASVRVCTEIRYGGVCEAYEADIAELTGVLNDAISSYRTPAGAATP